MKIENFLLGKKQNKTTKQKKQLLFWWSVTFLFQSMLTCVIAVRGWVRFNTRVQFGYVIF